MGFVLPVQALAPHLARLAPWAAAVGGLLVLLAGVLLGTWIARWRIRRRVARHRRLGREGGKKALALLEREGFRVVDTEVTAEGRLIVDGESRDYRVRADALVKRWFRLYVAEFKGGPEFARPLNRSTRRQLLEYALLFDVHGILLVDADRGRIRRVEFPRRR